MIVREIRVQKRHLTLMFHGSLLMGICRGPGCASGPPNVAVAVAPVR
jgi:hypothetical protein